MLTRARHCKMSSKRCGLLFRKRKMFKNLGIKIINQNYVHEFLLSFAFKTLSHRILSIKVRIKNIQNYNYTWVFFL